MADAVTRCNDVLLDVIRATGGAPGPISRGAAMMHAAVHDAVNSITGRYVPYLVAVPAQRRASVEAAAAHAAAGTLRAAFPAVSIDVERELVAGLTRHGSREALRAGREVGRACAAAMIAARSADGAAQAGADPCAGPAAAAQAGGDPRSDRIAAAPGVWRPAAGRRAETPGWGRVRPFVARSGSQFRPPPPGGYRSAAAVLGSREYAAQLDEVKRLGESSSAARSAQQTRIASFWANDVDGSCKPAGQLLAITRTVALQKQLGLAESARLFALVALALADAAICAWDAKFLAGTSLWRPEIAVHEAARDGNPRTAADVAWEPLSRDGVDGLTPSSPSYVSAHATLAAAHASVMRRCFATDSVTFDVTSDDPALPARVTRTFNSFSSAAREHARSRVYLGVAFAWDADHGYLAGGALGDYVAARALRPRPARRRRFARAVASPIASAPPARRAAAR